MKFDLNKSYKFDFNRKVVDNKGDTYFYLKYEGATTVPGYENTILEYRVKALDCQKNWSESEIREKMPQMSCIVFGFYQGHHDGELPSFPYLVLDWNSILRQFFEIGKTYLFTVEGKAIDSNTNCEYYSLRDEKINWQDRYYFKKDPLWSAGDRVELMVDGFSDKAYLQLSLSSMENLKAEITRMELAEDLSCKRESESLEFKSSFVYTAEGKADIDEQLGHEIMAQLAGFMNADGGMVCLGYRDDGSVCGINEDILLLNTSKMDKYNGQYKETLDGIELKIRNMIKYKLGAYVAPLVRVEFYRAQNDHLVCFLKVSPSSNIIYVDRDEMYVRAGNICNRLYGDERSRFEQNKRNVFKNPIEISKDVLKTAREVSSEYKSPIKVLTLYKNGDTSYQCGEVESGDVLFNIPLSKEIMDEKGRLVFLYKGGYVNIMNPTMAIKNKFTGSRTCYSNGFNTEAGLLRYCVCTVDDTLCVYTEKNNQSDVEAFKIANYRVNKSMNTAGRRILKKKYSKITDIKVVHEDLPKGKLDFCPANDAA